MKAADLSTILRDARLQLGYSYADLAQRVQMSKSTLQRYETGAIQDIPFGKLLSIAAALQLDARALLGLDAEAASPDIRWAQPLADAYEAAVPAIREAVCSLLRLLDPPACGKPAPVYLPVLHRPTADDLPAWTQGGIGTVEAFPAGVVPQGSSFAVQMDDPAMQPTLPEGATLFIRQQPTVHNNEMGLFLLSGEVLCRRYFASGDGVLLLCDNPSFPPLSLQAAQECMGVVGKVVGVFLR